MLDYSEEFILSDAVMNRIIFLIFFFEYSLLVFWFSISSWVSFDNLCLSKNLSISSKLMNLLP